MVKLKFKKPTLTDARPWVVPGLAACIVVAAGVTIWSMHNRAYRVNFEKFIQANNPIVRSEVQGGYGQIYYEYEGRKTYITSSDISKTAPVVHRNSVAWVGLVNGQGQIYTHDLLTHATVQVTSAGTNLNPKVYKNKVVWEKSVDGVPQVFYFDGTQVRQVSNGNEPALRPVVNDNSLAYARQLAQDKWEVVRVSLADFKEETVATGDVTNAWPQFNRTGDLTTKYDPFATER